MTLSFVDARLILCKSKPEAFLAFSGFRKIFYLPSKTTKQFSKAVGMRHSPTADSLGVFTSEICDSKKKNSPAVDET